jgi:hypothetical protein
MKKYCSNNIKRIYTKLFNVFLFFIIFDGTKEGLILSPIVRNIEIFLCEGLLFLLFFLAIFCNKKVKITGQTTLYFLMLVFIPVVLASMLSMNAFILSWLGIFRLTKPFLFFFILINLKTFYLTKEEQTVKYILILTFLMFAFTLIIYYQFPHLIEKKYYIKRVGLGNPSIQSGLFFAAFILCVYYRPFKLVVNIVFTITFIIGIVLSVSSTALLAFVFACFLFMFNKYQRKFITLILLASVITFSLLVLYYWDFFEPVFQYFLFRLDELTQLLAKYITLSSERTESGSFHTRENQISLFFYNLELRPIDAIFGNGTFTVLSQRYSDLLLSNHSIENLYISIFHDYGIVGLILLFYVLLKFYIRAFFSFIKKGKTIQLVVVTSFCFYGVPLVVFYMFNLSCIFMFLFYWFFERKPTRNDT